MDLTGLIQRLPSMCEGGQRWITQFEEKTAGQHLALGDIKAILCQTAGKGLAEEILKTADIEDVTDNPQADPVPFGGYRTAIWNAIRTIYPPKMDPGKLEVVKLQEDENVMTFVQSFQDKWRNETGAKWDSSAASVGLFKMLLKNALPEEVQKKLEEVVGLSSMEWTTFMAHITHHVEQYRKLKKEAIDATETLLTQLYKAQLGEITRTKQDEKERKKENVKQAALVIPAQPTTPPDTAVGMRVPESQGYPQMQVMQGSAMMQPGPHDYMYPTGPPIQAEQPFWGRGRGYGRGRFLPQVNMQTEGCWECGDPRHIRRNCPYLPKPTWGDRVDRAERRGQVLGSRVPHTMQESNRLQPPWQPQAPVPTGGQMYGPCGEQGGESLCSTPPHCTPNRNQQ